MECGLTNPARAGMQQRQFAPRLPWSPWCLLSLIRQNKGYCVLRAFQEESIRYSKRVSYQVIARKYRPQRFEEVVGQNHVTQTLTNAIQQKRIAHAYLFTGPRGTGKTTLARIFAKCLNCTDGPRTDFPDDDPRCLEISEGRSMDVMEIDGASNRGIEEIRELRETVKYAPSSSSFKIYIIDEVHMLTKEAFNALLKTLEEPPAHVKFMFATTEPEKVLPTILSRCQRFDLGRIPDDLIVEHLRKIAAKESVTLDEPALAAIARGAEGGMRDAASTLDQLISFCGNKIVEADVLTIFGLAGRDQIQKLAGFLIEGKIGEAMSLLDELSGSGKDLSRLLSDIQQHFRNLMILKLAPEQKQLLSLISSEMHTLEAQSAQVTEPGVLAMLECLNQAEARFKQTTSKRIHLELAFAQTIEARHAMPLNHVLGKLKGLRSTPPDLGRTESQPVLSTPEPPRTAPVSQPPRKAVDLKTSPPPQSSIKKQPEKVSKPASSALTDLADESLKHFWAEVVEGIGRASPFAKSYFIEAHAVSFKNGVLTLGFDPEFSEHLSFVDNVKNKTLIQNKVIELGYGKPMIKFVVAEAPEHVNQSPETPNPDTFPAQEVPQVKPLERPKLTELAAEPERIDLGEFKDDPLIKEALELFKGHVVDVRR